MYSFFMSCKLPDQVAEVLRKFGFLAFNELLLVFQLQLLWVDFALSVGGVVDVVQLKASTHALPATRQFANHLVDVDLDT